MVQASVFNIALLCVLAGIVVVHAQQKTQGDCFEYCGSKPEEATGLLTVCVPGRPNCSLCMFFENPCPKVEECGPTGSVLTPDGRCRVCPGEVCAVDEKAYKAGDEVNSKDGQNKCKCQADGTLKCSAEKFVPIRELCNV
ncbi:uncharacterized protein LOC117318187 [Pecten maximus]|uniref:uncharacterized protein LOC117318187 n=1 Tax=Pecten maximus TaxID=6579 RepID=UPI0014587BE3|nr:uncharacterized protein LOC117318187 [Pecten maximus]